MQREFAPADHRDHRPRHRQRGRPGLHHRRAGPAGAQRAARRRRAWSATVARRRMAEWAEKVRRRSPRRRGLMNVAVVGAAGYAGGELLRLLHQHPEVRGVRRHQPEPRRERRSPRRIRRSRRSPTPASPARRPGEIAQGRDVVFLCLEHGESSRVAAEVFAARPGLVVDLAADFRVRDRALYERYYGPHPGARAAAPLLLRAGRRPRPRPAWRRGAGRTRVLRDRGAAGALSAGAGRARPVTLASSRSPARAAPACSRSPPPTIRCGRTTCSPTRCSGHRHEAEVLQSWREWIGRPDARARLMTHSGPFVRGIYLTLHAYLPRESRDQRRRSRDRGGGLVPRGVCGPAVRSRARHAARAHPCGGDQLRLDPRGGERRRRARCRSRSRSTTW